ncbi:MAG TPA: DUF3068 domain-containing protein [Intrasporangiaceae bacterium]|nr:DUF3068 domain-containing protein [Intrasporangiaceae bacterium]
MRSVLGKVLLGLAGFLITAALLVAWYVPGQMKKTPLDVDSKTRLSGQAAALPTGGSSPVKALSHTVANGELSDGDVIVFDTFTCLVKDDGTVEDCTDDGEAGSALITASTDTFATDRRTAEAVNDPKYVSANSTHEGLVNKWPFDVKKETYPYWDGLLGRSIDATFDGEEEIEGLNTYRFVTNVQDEKAEIASGVDGTYSTAKTLWIDPVTGSIIKQDEKQVRKTEDGTTVLDLDFGFTDETVAANVESAKESGGKLGLLSTAPWVLGLLGLLALGLGGFLASRGRAAEEPVYVDETAPVGDEAYQDSTEQFFDEAEGETRASRREAQE